MSKNSYQSIKSKFEKYLEENNLRKTQERFHILEEIYKHNKHFDAESLYLKMKYLKFRLSRATIYNTIEVLLECGLIRKHHFGKQSFFYEKTHDFCPISSDCKIAHDHIILENDEILEFIDPRIEEIKKSVEKKFDIKIDSHLLYFYGKRNEKK